MADWKKANDLSKLEEAGKRVLAGLYASAELSLDSAARAVLDLVAELKAARKLAESFEVWRMGDDKDDPEGGGDLFDACAALEAYLAGDPTL